MSWPPLRHNWPVDDEPKDEESVEGVGCRAGGPVAPAGGRAR